MKKIEKWELKYPIGTILKHNSCNLMYEVIDYQFELGHKNYCGVLLEEFVVLKTLYYPENKIDQLEIYYIDYLREFKESNFEYLEKLLEKRKKDKIENLKIEKFEQLKLF